MSSSDPLFLNEGIFEQAQAQLLTELRFILGHSIESRKVRIKEYFSLLLTFQQNSAAKKMKDYFYLRENTPLFQNDNRRALLKLIFKVLKEYNSIYLDTSETMLWRIIDHLILKIANFQYCSQCFESYIIRLPKTSKFKSPQNQYYCMNCQESTIVHEQFDLFPVFLEYLVDLSTNSQRYDQVNSLFFKKQCKHTRQSTKHQNLIILFYEIFEDLYQEMQQNFSLENIHTLWSFGEKLNFEIAYQNKNPAILVLDYLVEQIEKGDYEDYSQALELMEKFAPPGKIEVQDFILKGGAKKNILRAISVGNIPAIDHSLNFAFQYDLIHPLEFFSSPHFSAACYRGLFTALNQERFDHFEILWQKIQGFGIKIDSNLIPNRYSTLTGLIAKAIKYRRLDRIFDILKFALQYGLLHFSESGEITKDLRNIKRNVQVITNIGDLLHIDQNMAKKNDLLHYVFFHLPEVIVNNLSFLLGIFPEFEDTAKYLWDFFDNYTFYGLSLKRIGTITQFLKKVDALENSERIYQKEETEPENNYELKFAGRSILINQANIDEIKTRMNIKPRKYEFLMLGMVTKGGLGPQGYGFVYTTPRGELIEICSDTQANLATIVRFKQFLQQDFLEELNQNLKTLALNTIQQEELLNILEGRLPHQNLFSFQKEEFILRQIRDYLEDEFDFRRLTSNEVTYLFQRISAQVHNILMPITLVDQYWARLDLVARKIIDPNEVAKLTSLEDKSHYDLLTERYFFQAILLAFRRLNRDEDFAPAWALEEEII